MIRVSLLLYCFICLFTYADYAQKINTSEINRFIDEWHLDAAKADMEAYFEKIDENGIYIGTDATEIWTKQEFYDWAKSYFDKGKAWSFTRKSRNVYVYTDGNMAWFDELLNSPSCVLRGSGVLIRKKGEWKIKHYVLSLPVPNEKFKNVLEVMKEEGSSP